MPILEDDMQDIAAHTAKTVRSYGQPAAKFVKSIGNGNIPGVVPGGLTVDKIKGLTEPFKDKPLEKAPEEDGEQKSAEELLNEFEKMLG